jgi:hypothetical protein
MAIEKLDIVQKSEILGVLRQAFATHPMLPKKPLHIIFTLKKVLLLIKKFF